MRTIYIDMDGVVADFDTVAQEIMQATAEERRQAQQNGRWPDHKWQQILTQQNFYRILPRMPQADQMMALARRFRDELGWRLRMLTAIPKNNDFPECYQDKFDWMAEHYPGIRVIFGPYSEDKQHHCRPGDILVDDRKSNIEQWRARGGRAVHVTRDYDQALAELEALFEQIKGTGS
jgi:5'(3')-deoxyribonucleotidase